jgi:hypothetical protein
MASPFSRPSLKQFLGGSAPLAERNYGYPRRMFVEHDIFDLLPLDGGAFFFTNQLLGGAGTGLFTQGFKSGKLLGSWTGNRCAPTAADIDWVAAYDPEKGPWSPGQQIERHVWLHRLYFLLPFAQEYLRTGKTEWARRWFDFFIAWRRHFPAMGDPLARKAKFTAFIWYDMQPTWRLLVLLHSVFMLGGRRGKSSPLMPGEWAEVYKAIAAHARWVQAEAEDGLNRNATGNHFLQKGTALVAAGTLFPELDGAAAWVKTGQRVIRDQMRREINRDGGSIEASPSYSHFIARLYLDAHLVLQANGQPAIPGLKASIRRQYTFLEGTMSPSGRTLQVGDSYALDARRDLAIVRRLFPLPAVRALQSRCFEASRFVVLHAGETDVYLDAMDVACGHIHTPKPNLMVYRQGRPVLVDCGCVNYDLPEYARHFQTWPAHNVIAPAAFVKDPAARRVVELKLTRFVSAPDGGTAEVLCRYAGKDAKFAWQRVVQLAGDAIEILDRVRSSRRETFAIFFHLAAGARPAIAIRGRRGKLPVQILDQPAVDEKNRRVLTRTVTCRQIGRDVVFRTHLTPKLTKRPCLGNGSEK